MKSTRPFEKAAATHLHPSLCITKVLISDLRLDPRNPRLHSERQIKQLANSIKTFGFVSPVLIDADQRVIAGHGRIEAAKLAGFNEVPTISIRHLSETQLRAYVIADNRLAEQASWNETLLAEQLKALSEVELDFNLEVTGFEVGEIDVMIEGLEPAVEAESDPADLMPEAMNSIQVTKNGDLWMLERHRVLCGNSLNRGSYSTLMDGCLAGMVFTDPPYNVRITGHATGLGTIQHKNFKMAFGEMSEADFTNFLAQAFSLQSIHSRDGSLHYICMDWRHTQELLTAGK